MISMIQPLPVGNALRVFLEPPIGSVYWRVLRKGSDAFSGPEDDTALLAYEGDEKIFVDFASLQNEVMAFYRPYYNDGTSWVAGPTSSSTPAATYEEYTTDVMSIMRNRIEQGMLVEVQRGSFQPELGYVQVYTAPPSLEQGLRFPLVTIHLDNESPAQRALGESISGDEFDEVGFDWIESEGWLAQVQLSIVAWSLNSDERIELRKALRRLIISNLPVLDASGITEVSASFQDIDAVNGEYNAPIYQVMCSFSCVAPVRIGNRVNPVADVEVQISNVIVGAQHGY